VVGGGIPMSGGGVLEVSKGDFFDKKRIGCLTVNQASSQSEEGRRDRAHGGGTPVEKGKFLAFHKFPPHY